MKTENQIKAEGLRDFQKMIPIGAHGSEIGEALERFISNLLDEDYPKSK